MVVAFHILGNESVIYAIDYEFIFYEIFVKLTFMKFLCYEHLEPYGSVVRCIQGVHNGIKLHF